MSMSNPSVEMPPITRTFAKPMSALDARFEAQKIAFGPVVFQCVRIARNWGLLARIDASAEGLTIQELARETGYSDYAVSVVLETCLSAGMVSVVDDRYRIEKTGQMLHFKNPCIVLEQVYCGGEMSKYRLFCPRAIYPYWREIWLERTSPPAGPGA